MLLLGSSNGFFFFIFRIEKQNRQKRITRVQFHFLKNCTFFSVHNQNVDGGGDVWRGKNLVTVNYIRLVCYSFIIIILFFCLLKLQESIPLLCFQLTEIVCVRDIFAFCWHYVRNNIQFTNIIIIYRIIGQMHS